MGGIEVKFVLKTKPEDMLRHIQIRSEKHLATKMKRVKKLLLDIIPGKLKRAITTDDEFWLLKLELTNHKQLYGEFGVVGLEEKLDKIIDHWCSSIDASDEAPFRFTRSGITGHLRVKLIKADYSDVLAMPEAREIVTSLKSGMIELNWLEWLLFGGDDFIIRDFIYFENDKTPQYSRTGKGIMRPKAGSGWKIPPEFAGSQEDNFLTRVLDKVLDSVTADIFAKLEKYA